MTTVTFLTEDARIIGFDVQGHSGWGESGEDIVCAAITSAVRLVEATVNDVMGLCAAVKVREGQHGRVHLSESSDGADGLSGAASRRISR